MHITGIVTAETTIEKGFIEIYDLVGRRVQTTALEHTMDNTTTIATSHLTAGTYMVLITNQDRSIKSKHKFIKL